MKKSSQLRNRVALVGLIMVLPVLVFSWWHSGSSRAAPDVSFKTITNQTINLSQLRGQPVLITFWATDCPACIEEIPHLLELFREFHPRGLEIIAVAMYYDPPSHVAEMSKILQLPYAVALDLRAEHSKAFGGVMLTPTTFLISPQGHIVLQKLGKLPLQQMKRNIETLLGDASQPDDIV